MIRSLMKSYTYIYPVSLCPLSCSPLQSFVEKICYHKTSPRSITVVTMPASADQLEKARVSCPVLQDFPPGWMFDLASDSNPDLHNRIFFIKQGAAVNSFTHPARGPLPGRWILKLVEFTPGKGDWKTIYFDRETKEFTRNGVRKRSNILAQAVVPFDNDKGVWGASSSVKIRHTSDFDTFSREPALNRSIADRFRKVHAIDAGDGTLGQFNSGVFVVKLSGNPNKLFIQKKFKGDEQAIQMAKTEITICRKVMHPSLTGYHAAYVVEDGLIPSASLYIKFCDRGSVRDLLEKYTERINEPKQPHVQEALIWHVFIGLMDALAYLQTGNHCLGNKSAPRKKDWIPILHRDIKCDNILLRSRATSASRKYFYCVLSDLGLACENPDLQHGQRHPNREQESGGMCGTGVFLAPELCHDPYAQTDDQRRRFPGNERHSKRSDAWAVGACIYTLAQAPHPFVDMCFIDFYGKPPGVDQNDWNSGRASKKRIGLLKTPTRYTRELCQAVLLVTGEDPTKRLDPTNLVHAVAECNRRVGGWILDMCRSCRGGRRGNTSILARRSGMREGGRLVGW
jgi:serine/threonine protein kinase